MLPPAVTLPIAPWHDQYLPGLEIGPYATRAATVSRARPALAGHIQAVLEQARTPVVAPLGGIMDRPQRLWRAGLVLLAVIGVAGCSAIPTPAPPTGTPGAAPPSASPTPAVITAARPTPGGTPKPTTIPGAATSLPAPPTLLASPVTTVAPLEAHGTAGPPQPAAPLAPPAIQATTDIPLAGGTTRFDYQSLDPQTGRLFIAHLGASLVTVFDVRTNQVVTDIPKVAQVHGVLAVPALGRVYASATGDNQVAVIDARRLQVTARVPAGDYPDGLAYDPRSGHVFVSDEARATDTVIDTATNTRIATIPLGGEAGNTQYDAGSGRIFVAVQTRNQLVALDPATNTLVGRTDLPGCAHPHGLLIDAPGRRAFVACDENARLLTVDLATMQVRDSQTVPDTPDVLTYDPGWQRLYVATESGGLAIFDVAAPRPRVLVNGFFAAGAHSVAVDPASHRVYLPLADRGGRPVLRILDYAGPPPATP